MTHACRCGGPTVNARQTVGAIIAQGAGAATAEVPLDPLLAALDEARKACS
jgi:hypothetical protein